MKNTIRAFACGTVAALAAIGLSQSVQAQQTISGWGADSGDVGGVTITDNGSGNFVASGLPTGNADWRANLPTPINGLAVGQSVTVLGTLAWTAGYMAAGLFRIGLIDTRHGHIKRWRLECGAKSNNMLLVGSADGWGWSQRHDIQRNRRENWRHVV